MVQNVGPARRWTAVVILALAAVMCAADRAVPMLLMDPIKHSMRLSDSQLAMLTGFSFIIAMSVAALPLAWIADRSNRRFLLAAAIAVWCSMTVASGFARDFMTLFIFRMGVGVGEAALTPAAYSLLADLFPTSRLARPLGAVTIAGALGSVLAVSLGGLLYESIHHAGLGALPNWAPHEAWRLTTIIVGGVGLLIAGLALLLPEPREGAPIRHEVGPAPAAEGVFPYLARNRKFFVPYVAGLSLYCIYAAAVFGWLAPLFGRNFGWSIGQVGQAVAVMTVGAGLVGPLAGIVMFQWAGKRLGRPAPVLVICAALTLSLPCIALAPVARNATLALVLFAITTTLSGACSIVSPIVMTSVSPAHLRARVVAASTLMFGLFAAIGPVIYAGFNESVFRDASKLGLTMAVLSPILVVASILLFVVSDRRYVAVSEDALRQSKVPSPDSDLGPIPAVSPARI
jgi:MFS family permease